MDFLGDFHFIRPAAFWLIPIAVVIWWLWQRLSDPLRGWRMQIDPDLLAALVVGQNKSQIRPVHFILLAWLVAIIAVAGPTWRLEPSPFADDATPLMILLKVDISMETADPAPTRLERARLKITDLAKARQGQPLGLIAYAGSAHLVLPPTRDTAAVAEMASEISPEIMPVKGDRLDLALNEAERILKGSNQGGSMVVIADSVETEGDQLKSMTNDLGFPVQFLAINSPDTAESESLSAAARILDAPVAELDYEDRDIASLIRRAANAPLAESGEGGDRWMESGYWLVPLVGILLLSLFRREQAKEVPQ
ncbi:MAG: VWA domain-containing protein [Verrucomicrobiota bacterium]